MIKGAIFDLDGTLLDSMFVWDTIGEINLRSIGYEPKENLNETFKTMSLYNAACYYKSEYGVTLSVDEIMDGVNRMVEKYYINEVQLKTGVYDFIKHLHNIGVKMCIATATDKYLVEAALERCGIKECFSEIFTCTDVGHGKDEPFIFRKAMDYLGTARENTVVFEDAYHAAKTAKSDGFITVAVFDSHETKQAELHSVSDCFIENFTQTEHFWKFAYGL